MNYICEVCGLPLEVMVCGYRDDPFVDGRLYEEMCHICSCVPVRVVFNEKTKEWDWYDHISPDRLATVATLMNGGWDKSEAEYAIKAVKKLLKNPKLVIVPEGGTHIFDTLFLEIDLAS